MSQNFPSGEIAIRTVAMPADANPAGDIFGGWIVGQMDVASGFSALRRAQGRVVTVAIDAMVFHQPVLVGDELTIYTTLLKVGKTSLAYHVEAWARRRSQTEFIQVTEGTFTFVAVDENRRPRPVPPVPEGI